MSGGPSCLITAPWLRRIFSTCHEYSQWKVGVVVVERAAVQTKGQAALGCRLAQHRLFQAGAPSWFKTPGGISPIPQHPPASPICCWVICHWIGVLLDCCTNGGEAKEGRAFGDSVLGLAARVESLLFVADAPASIGRLAEALEATPGQVERALADLEATYAGRGLRLQRAGSRVQLITAPEVAPCIERFLGLEAHRRLSRAALETLAIVAYRQPVTRPEIETIRGVSSDSVLRTLLGFGLIEGVGRAPTVGRPILYGTTFEFLQHFGLRSLDELPSLDGMPDSMPASEGV